jgi:hypothetical protein
VVNRQTLVQSRCSVEYSTQSEILSREREQAMTERMETDQRVEYVSYVEVNGGIRTGTTGLECLHQDQERARGVHHVTE